MIDGKNFFDQSVQNDLITSKNIQNVATGQGDDYTTDPKAIQQINFTGILDRGGQTAMFFIIEEVKETITVFSQGTVRVL